MKKLMKKIKSNKLISKLVAVLTICMVLLSSLSVSAFAADDEVSAANEETESITDVWTGVTDSIMSLLGTAQGVFVSNGGLIFFDYVPIDGTFISSVPNFPSLSVGDYLTVFGNNEVSTETIEGVVLDPSDPLLYDLDVNGLNSFDSTFCILFEGSATPLFYFNAVYDGSLGAPSGLVSGWSSNSPPFNPILGYISSGSSLTFLGTLATVAVAIALIMLLVYVISRFLRLRG